LIPNILEKMKHFKTIIIILAIISRGREIAQEEGETLRTLSGQWSSFSFSGGEATGKELLFSVKGLFSPRRMNTLDAPVLVLFVGVSSSMNLVQSTEVCELLDFMDSICFNSLGVTAEE